MKWPNIFQLKFRSSYGHVIDSTFLPHVEDHSPPPPPPTFFVRVCVCVRVGWGPSRGGGGGHRRCQSSKDDVDEEFEMLRKPTVQPMNRARFALSNRERQETVFLPSEPCCGTKRCFCTCSFVSRCLCFEFEYLIFKDIIARIH